MQGLTNNRPDLDLIPSNVRKDKDIFGVVGDFEGSGIGSLGSWDTLTGTQGGYARSIQYKQIGNLYLFGNFNTVVQLGVSNPIENDNTTREMLKTLLGKSTVESYLDSAVWSYDQHGGRKHTGSFRSANSGGPGIILVAMILS